MLRTTTRVRTVAGVLAVALVGGLAPTLVPEPAAASRAVRAAVVRDFTARFRANERGDVLAVGNTLVTCSTPATAGAPACSSAQGGTSVNNNDYVATNVDVDSVGTTVNSSSATLTVPTGGAVLWAGLYWMGSAGANDAGRASIRLAAPGRSYTTLTGAVSTGRNATSGTTGGFAYSGFAEVTTLVQASGTYTVGGLTTNLGTNARGGWAIVAVVRDPAQPLRNLSVYDGYAEVTGAPADQRVATTLTGFLTPSSGTVTARVGAIASDGDLATTGDGLSVNNVAVSDALNPANNVFNSTISRLGARVTAKTPNHVNQLGFDVDYMAVPAGAITNGSTSATVAFTTGGESYEPMALFTAIDIFEPDVSATKVATRVGGGTKVNPGDQVEYTVGVTSDGSEDAAGLTLADPLPTGLTYVPGSLSVNGTAVTDAAGDDTGEYVAATRRVGVRLGTGATASAGGRLAAGATATVRFRVQVAADVPAASFLANQATLDYRSPTTGTAYSAVTDDPAVAGTAGPTVIDVNDAPVGGPVAVSTPEDTPFTFALTTGATDPDGDTLSFTTTSVPAARGTLSCTTTGSCTFAPAADATGTVTFSYTATDTGGRQATGTATITITPVNDPPTAVADTAQTHALTPVTVQVLDNDTDRDGDTLAVVAATTSSADGGTVVCTTAACTYTPRVGFSGTDTFTYQARDPADARASATVTVTVLATTGSLAISVPATDVIGTIDVGAATISGRMGTVTVSDSRNLTTSAWTTTASASAFVTGTGVAAAERVPASSVTYDAGPPSRTTGVGRFTPAGARALGTPQVVATWAGDPDPTRTGSSASWHPTLTVTLRPDQSAGTYTGTITHSVA